MGQAKREGIEKNEGKREGNSGAEGRDGGSSASVRAIVEPAPSAAIFFDGVMSPVRRRPDVSPRCQQIKRISIHVIL